MINPEIDSDEIKRWFNSLGQLHREDGPAVEYAHGTKAWWLNGELHRGDGPAIEWPDGDKWWYLNGKRHREDGPAIESNEIKEWWLNGTELSEELFKKVTQGPLRELPLYIGLGFDEFIGKRLRSNE